MGFEVSQRGDPKLTHLTREYEANRKTIKDRSNAIDRAASAGYWNAILAEVEMIRTLVLREQAILYEESLEDRGKRKAAGTL